MAAPSAARTRVNPSVTSKFGASIDTSGTCGSQARSRRPRRHNRTCRKACRAEPAKDDDIMPLDGAAIAGRRPDVDDTGWRSKLRPWNGFSILATLGRCTAAARFDLCYSFCRLEYMTTWRVVVAIPGRLRMNFELTSEQIQVRDMVKEFAEREVAPYIQEWESKGEYHPEILRKMGELGILGLPIPERYGGGGFDYVSFALACEELEAVDTFLRVVMSVHVGLN